MCAQLFHRNCKIHGVSDWLRMCAPKTLGASLIKLRQSWCAWRPHMGVWLHAHNEMPGHDCIQVQCVCEITMDCKVRMCCHNLAQASAFPEMSPTLRLVAQTAPASLIHPTALRRPCSLAWTGAPPSWPWEEAWWET